VASAVKTRLTLEMRSPDKLVRERLNPRIKLRAVPADDAVLVRIFHEVGDRHLWSAECWASWGSPPAKRHWLIDVDTEPAGLLTLLTNPTGDVEVVSFGLVPDRQGQGLGGAALTLAVDLAWTACAEKPLPTSNDRQTGWDSSVDDHRQPRRRRLPQGNAQRDKSREVCPRRSRTVGGLRRMPAVGNLHPQHLLSTTVNPRFA
jgi:GNAT superfamily N-acetyltransferase